MFTVKVQYELRGAPAEPGEMPSAETGTETKLFEAEEVTLNQKNYADSHECYEAFQRALNEPDASAILLNLDPAAVEHERPTGYLSVAIIRLKTSGQVDNLIWAVKSNVYVMNDNGVTVDRAHCA